MWLRRVRRSGRCTTTGSGSAASRSRWWSPKSRRSRASRHRWFAWNTQRKRTSRTSIVSVMRPSPLSRRSSHSAPPKPRGDAERRSLRPRCATTREYHVPIEHHNPMELFASTVMFEGDGKLTVYDKTQGVQNVQRYFCGVFEHGAGRCARALAVCRRRVRLRAASAISGGPGGAGGAGAEALGASRADPAADVRAWLPARHDPADRTRRERRRHARRDHARSDHGDVAIRGFPPARDRLVGPALQMRQREICAQARAARSRHAVRHARAQCGQRRLSRSNARWTSSRSP